MRLAIAPFNRLTHLSLIGRMPIDDREHGDGAGAPAGSSDCGDHRRGLETGPRAGDRRVVAARVGPQGRYPSTLPVRVLRLEARVVRRAVRRRQPAVARTARWARAAARTAPGGEGVHARV